MHVLLSILVISTLAAGCSLPKPVAKLTYTEITKVTRAYEIKFSSDLNPDTLFNPDVDEKVVVRRLICALDDDADFSVKHTLKRYFRGEFVALPAPNPATLDDSTIRSSQTFMRRRMRTDELPLKFSLPQVT